MRILALAILVAAVSIVWAWYQDRRVHRKRSSSTQASPSVRHPQPARHVPPPNLPQADIERLVNAGQYIQAIKAYRATYGVSLKQAKEAIDAMRDR